MTSPFLRPTPPVQSAIVADQISWGVRELLSAAKQLGLTWSVRPATVVGDGTHMQTRAVPVVVDHDSAVSPAVSLLGPVGGGARVMTLAVPPSGLYLIGWYGPGPASRRYMGTLVYERTGSPHSFAWRDHPGLLGVTSCTQGGGGAGGGTVASATDQRTGGGGGGGGYAEQYFGVDQLADVELFTVGAAGSASSGSAGGAGGNTAFRDCVGNGGSGGAVGNSVNNGGGDGGDASGGYFTRRGGDGVNGRTISNNSTLQGDGGESFCAGSRRGIATGNAAGRNGWPGGGGGSGGLSGTGGTNQAGGAGGAGRGWLHLWGV